MKQRGFTALKSFFNSIESSVFKTRNNVELHRACKLLKNSETTTHIPPGVAISLSALKILLSVTASLDNALILFALHNVRTIHLQPPTILLSRCLAVTDLCIALIKQPLFAIILLQAVTRINLNIFAFVEGVEHSPSDILCGVSILQRQPLVRTDFSLCCWGYDTNMASSLNCKVFMAK